MLLPLIFVARLSPNDVVSIAVFGEVAEGLDTLHKINELPVDEQDKPIMNVRIRHTIILDDPFPDPAGLEKLIPDRSPSPVVCER